MATGLSAAGYVTVCGIMGLENLLDGTEGLPGTGDRERLRDPGLYYLRVFGEPGGAQPWAVPADDVRGRPVEQDRAGPLRRGQ